MMDFLWRVWWLRSSPHPCSKPARESFGESVRTKATLKSSISRLLLDPNLGKKAAPQDGYLGTAFSRQSLRNANHQPARMRPVSGQKRWGAGNPAARNEPRKEQGRQRSIPQTALPAPDIEIGLRRPVEAIMARFQSGHM
jgi:hypothetical protein